MTSPSGSQEVSGPEQQAGASDGTVVNVGGDVKRLLEENDRLRGEVENLKTRPSQAARDPHSKRSAIAWVLVVLTSISLVLSTTAVWIDRTIWNTDRFVALVAPLPSDPAVRSAVSAQISSSVSEALDLQQRVQSALADIPKLPPAAATFLTGPITSAAESATQRAVAAFLATPTFQKIWVQSMTQVHEKVVALLRGDYASLPNVAISGGEVRLNLISAITEAIRQVVQSGLNGLNLHVSLPAIPANLDPTTAIHLLESALGTDLPPDFGQVTIMSQSQLATYQRTANDLDRLVTLLVVVTLLLLAATFLVSPARRRTVVRLGVVTVAALIVGGIFLRRVEARIVDSISHPGAQAAAKNVFVHVSASLRHAGIGVALVAIIAAVVAYIAGRPAWLLRTVTWVRNVGPTGRERASWLWIGLHAEGLRLGSIVIAVVVIFLTGIAWVPVTIVGTLLGLALWGIGAAERSARAPGGRIPSQGDQPGTLAKRPDATR